MAIIRGTAGDDRLKGTAAADELYGYTGDDVLTGGARGDLLDGGLGTDAASYSNAPQRVVADLFDPSGNQGHAAGDRYVSIERLVGSNFNDELRGGERDSVLFGGRGDDTLIGQFATTTLVGGRGADTLIGLGASTIAAYWNSTGSVRVNLGNPERNTGEARGDTFDNIYGLSGSRFNDYLYGDKRDNLLEGGAGNDTLVGNAGNDRLDGGRGADQMFGGRGFDTAGYRGATSGVIVDLQNAAQNRGEARGDRLTSIEGIEGSNFNDTLRGDKQDNQLRGAAGADKLYGRAGKDSIFGELGSDRLYGGGGDDVLIGGVGADRLFGGAGFDKAAYWNAASGLTVDLQRPGANTGEARGDTYVSIEGVDGSSYSDILRGGAAGDRLFGRGGDDRLDGRNGHDVLFGGDGDDDLRGGAGNDTLIGDKGADKLYGGSGADAASYVTASEGVKADLANASTNTGDADGDVYSSIEYLSGSSYGDDLRGDGGDNRLDGGGGDDLLFGRDGDDRLIGGSGADTMFGGAGSDRLDGGAGRDQLTGGAGADTFVFSTRPSAAAVDDIADFQVGADVIALARAQFGNLPVGPLAAAAFHAGAVATTADQRILHDVGSGNIFFDADGSGSGAAVRFATVSAGVVLGAGDFVLF